QITKASDLLQSQSQAITAASAKVALEVDQARQGLGQQRGLLEDQSSQAARLLREQVNELQLHIVDTGQRLQQQTAAFAAGTDAARRALAEPVDALTAFGDTLAAQPSAFTRVAREQASAMVAMLEEAAQNFGRMASEQVAAMSAAARDLVNQVESELAQKADAANRLFDGLGEQGQKVQGRIRG